MALLVFYLPFLFSFVLLALVVQIIGKKKTDPNLPKGPRKLPIIGNIHNVLSTKPYRKLRDLAREYGSLMHLQLGEISTIVISSPDCAREVMKTHDINFAIRPQIIASELITYNSTGIISAPYGNYWRQLRKICTLELLSLKRVNSYQPIREEEFSNLVKWIASKNGSPINLTQAVFSSMYTIVSKAAFGKKCKNQEKFISAAKESIKIAGGFDLADLFPSITWLRYVTGLSRKLERVHRQIDQIMENIISEHKEANKQSESEKDLVDVLIKYEDGNKREFVLTTDNIKAIILVRILITCFK
jgi:cytochrome P450